MRRTATLCITGVPLELNDAHLLLTHASISRLHTLPQPKLPKFLPGGLAPAEVAETN